jgi:TetR/AcrR family transcriptional repressor of nem operon
MRYTKDHRKRTNKRIVEIASRRFRQDGIHAVGIAGLMSEAGLTHGGFYSHFKSKEDLITTSVAHALKKSFLRLKTHTQKNGDNLNALVSAYLHPVHREKPEKGCVFAAIGPELSRRPEESKEFINTLLEQFISMIDHYLPQTVPREKRHQTAMSIAALMVGAIQISRMLTDDRERDAVLENGIKSALLLAQAAASF